MRHLFNHVQVAQAVVLRGFRQRVQPRAVLFLHVAHIPQPVIDEAEPPAAGAALAAVTSIRKPPKPLPLLVMALLVMALLLPGRGRPILGRPDGKGPSQAPS